MKTHQDKVDEKLREYSNEYHKKVVEPFYAFIEDRVKQAVGSYKDVNLRIYPDGYRIMSGDIEIEQIRYKNHGIKTVV